MELIVTSLDQAPPELDEQVPFRIKLLRLIPGPDRPDYWLGEVLRPLFWMKNNRRIEVSHVIVFARWRATRIEPRVLDLPIGIAYVTDPTLLSDGTLHFEKCEYVAIGAAHETSDRSSSRNPTNDIWPGTSGRTKN